MTDEQAYLQQMEELHGPLARYSEYRIGQTVRYRSPDTGKVISGEITWITGPGQTVTGRPHPTEYWVDGLTVVYSSDIEGLAEPDEGSSLVHCPHCGALHQAGTVEQCPNRKRS